MTLTVPLAEFTAYTSLRVGFAVMPVGRGADLQYPLLAQIHQIEHGHRVAAAIGDVGEFAIVRRIFGKAPAAAAGECQRGKTASAMQATKRRRNCSRLAFFMVRPFFTARLADGRRGSGSSPSS